MHITSVASKVTILLDVGQCQLSMLNRRRKDRRELRMTRDEDTQDSYVITGILSICSIFVYIPADFGVMHSFISIACLAKINLSCEKTSSLLKVSIPSRGIIDTNKIAKVVQIDFDRLILRQIYMS